MPSSQTTLATDNLIDGAWVAADSGERFAVLDPATDEEIAKVPRGGAKETRAAIAAAAKAQPAWAALTANERGQKLTKLASLMHEKKEDLARLMTREQGKPIAESRGEIAYAASFFEHAAEEGKRIYGDILPASHANKRILVLRKPVGVTACITPWNFPQAMITRKLGPALAAGCTMVIKPAEQTPLSALALGALTLEAGIPAGVVNVVTGDAPAIGGELLSNPAVRKLSFTGSTEVGKKLIAMSAQNVTRLSLELGGHAPFIVFDDADLDAAVAGALANKYRNMGQTCICANRFYVQAGIYEAFTAKLTQAVLAMKVGYGLDEGTAVGPLIDDDAVDKVRSHVEDAVSKGAKLRAGGALVKPISNGLNGFTNRFFAPTVLSDFTDAMKLSREETFGPVAPLRSFVHEEEAVEMANDSIFGLAAYFFTRDASRLMRVAEKLDYGIIGANDAAPSVAQAPFGGVKQSGYGREGGKYVMHEYTDIQYVSWGL
jgi:succinate-semialdehyde dehydrogenase / glutarate-semialdehyde dehydrogenase